MIETAALARFGLLLVRPGMLVMATPVLGGVHVPPQVRIGLGVLLGIVIAPLIPPPAAFGTVGLVTAVAGEVVVGLSLAMGVRVLLAAAELGGHLVGFQIGFSYASIVDPQSGVRNNVLAALYGNLALITFLAINGHHAVIRALVASYGPLPVGGAGLSEGLGPSVSEMLGLVFVTGARLAAPVMTVVLLAELAVGLISRAAPALNLMIVGVPTRLLAGMAALAVGIQVVPAVVAGFAPTALEATIRLFRALS